jgi:hypothetical protein
MEKFVFLLTETQVGNVACELLWTGPDVHKGGREQLNLGVKERGLAQRQTLNTHEIFMQCHQNKVSKIKVTGGLFVCLNFRLLLGLFKKLDGRMR